MTIKTEQCQYLSSKIPKLKPASTAKFQKPKATITYKPVSLELISYLNWIDERD